MTSENMNFDYKFDPSDPENKKKVQEQPIDKKEKGKKISKKSPKSSKKINLWKYAFLTLVALLLAFVVVIGFRVTGTREKTYTPSATVAAGEPAFEVTATKAQVNEIIDYYLTEFLGDTGIQYSFYLENQAMLDGTFSLLGHELHFYFYFDPYVMENGNVQLKAKSLSIGTLSLPMSELFKYIQKQYKLPEWVEIDADNNLVVLNLNKFKLKSGIYLRADKINLVDDEIKMQVYLPTSSQATDTKESTTETTKEKE